MYINRHSKEETFPDVDSHFPIKVIHHDFQQQEFDLQMHWHNYLEVIHNIEGHTTYNINGYTVDAYPGDIIIINANQLHNATFRSEGRHRIDVVLVNYSFLKTQILDVTNESFIKPLMSGKYIFWNVIKKHDNEEVFKVFHSIINEFEEKRFGYELAIKTELYKMLTSLFRHNQFYENLNYNKKNESKNTSIITKTIEYIHDNYSQDLQLEQIASEVNVSRFHLCRLFKEKTGTTINTYMNNYRLSMAKQELVETDKDITNICFDVGYNNPSYFISLFKKQYGVTPKQFQQRKEK